MEKKLRQAIMSVMVIAVMAVSVLANSFNVQAAGISSDNRHLVISYTRPGKDYKTGSYNWNFWVWEDGSAGKAYAGTVTDGKLVADVTVSASCKKSWFYSAKKHEYQ